MKFDLNFRDLVSQKGVLLEIQSDFKDNYETEELFDIDREINDDFDEDEKQKFKNPWTENFEELKLKMEKISDYVYKKVNKPGNPDRKCPPRARVTLHYNGYIENSADSGPYDSVMPHY